MHYDRNFLQADLWGALWCNRESSTTSNSKRIALNMPRRCRSRWGGYLIGQDAVMTKLPLIYLTDWNREMTHVLVPGTLRRTIAVIAIPHGVLPYHTLLVMKRFPCSPTNTSATWFLTGLWLRSLQWPLRVFTWQSSCAIPFTLLCFGQFFLT